MKICPKCGAQLDDSASFCNKCGAPLNAPAQAPAPAPAPAAAPIPTPVPYVEPFDHTAEFTAKDISDNKVIAMLVYLMSFIGVIIALLAAHSSPYVAFHVRQSLKITVLEILTGIISAVLAVTLIVPLAGLVCLCILLVVKIICFFQVCGGKAKEPPIVRSFTFLK